MENAARNAVYTSHVAVVEFVEALGTWVEESTLRRLQKASAIVLWLMNARMLHALKSYRSAVVGRISRRALLGHHLKKADAESIYSAVIECLKQKNLQVSKIVGIGFDGASTFSGKKSGVQTCMKNLAPHALFVHCHCYLLQLACIQAANSTSGIKQVYTTLTSLWKLFSQKKQKR